MNQEQTGTPFENFARYYDRFMLRLVNYPAWVDYLIKIFNAYNLAPKTILDVACGTGIPSMLFAKKGYRVIGIDNSQTMLDVFKQKIVHTQYDIQIIKSDIRNFSTSEKVYPAPFSSPNNLPNEPLQHQLKPNKNWCVVDAAISLYDSINYLLTEDDLKSCFFSVFTSLNPEGLFAFDVNSIFCLESFWSNHETPRKVGGVYSIWRNTYNKEERISTLQLTVFTDDGGYFVETIKSAAIPKMN